MSDVEFILFGIALLFGLLACILFVVFGQVTVRKLRKKPELKYELGFEFVSGWDIVNVAHSLSMPEWVSRKLKEGSLSFLEANSTLIKHHTNKVDRFLAKSFCFFLYATTLIVLPLAILNNLGYL